MCGVSGEAIRDLSYLTIEDCDGPTVRLQGAVRYMHAFLIET